MAFEAELIDWIRRQHDTSPLVEVGSGDDLAVLKWPGDELLLVGVDQVIDGVHFDSSIHSPRQIGRKVMNRNLSDCAAMAALPAAVVATVALPRDFPLSDAREVYLGMKEAANPWNCPIVGGDTATWDGKLVATVTILARSAGVKPITRRGAKPGDGIYVTGPLGGSILGRHIDFTPRIDLGRQLAPFATAMIDISDGLSRDLRHICPSLGAILIAAEIPIHADAKTLRDRDGIPALDHALNDGEDYELLFTATKVPPAGIRIGTVTADSGFWIEDSAGRRELPAKGWEYGRIQGEGGT